MNSVRKPESHRGPQLARRAKAIDAGIRTLPRCPPASASSLRLPAQEADRLLALAGVDPRRQPDRQDRGDHEDHEGVAQRPLRAHHRRPRRDRRRDRHPDQSGHRVACVGGDEGEPVGQEPRHGGRPRHVVGLRGDQHPERGREQPEGPVDDGPGHHPAEERPRREGGPDRPAPAVAEPVEQRAEERCDDREREHGQAQEQRHLPAGLAGRDLEEQGAGQRDRHRRVGGRVERPELDQTGQAAAVRALGGRRAARRTVGGAAEPAGATTHRPDPPAGDLGPRAHGVAPRATVRLPGRCHGSILHGTADDVRAWRASFGGAI